jgi:hypothetical protein
MIRLISTVQRRTVPSMEGRCSGATLAAEANSRVDIAPRLQMFDVGVARHRAVGKPPKLLAIDSKLPANRKFYLPDLASAV